MQNQAQTSHRDQLGNIHNSVQNCQQAEDGLTNGDFENVENMKMNQWGAEHNEIKQSYIKAPAPQNAESAAGCEEPKQNSVEKYLNRNTMVMNAQYFGQQEQETHLRQDALTPATVSADEANQKLQKGKSQEQESTGGPLEIQPGAGVNDKIEEQIQEETRQNWQRSLTNLIPQDDYIKTQQLWKNQPNAGTSNHKFQTSLQANLAEVLAAGSNPKVHKSSGLTRRTTMSSDSNNNSDNNRNNIQVSVENNTDCAKRLISATASNFKDQINKYVPNYRILSFDQINKTKANPGNIAPNQPESQGTQGQGGFFGKVLSQKNLKGQSAPSNQFSESLPSFKYSKSNKSNPTDENQTIAHSNVQIQFSKLRSYQDQVGLTSKDGQAANTLQFAPKQRRFTMDDAEFQNQRPNLVGNDQQNQKQKNEQTKNFETSENKEQQQNEQIDNVMNMEKHCDDQEGVKKHDVAGGASDHHETVQTVHVESVNEQSSRVGPGVIQSIINTTTSKLVSQCQTTDQDSKSFIIQDKSIEHYNEENFSREIKRVQSLSSSGSEEFQIVNEEDSSQEQSSFSSKNKSGISNPGQAPMLGNIQSCPNQQSDQSLFHSYTTYDPRKNETYNPNNETTVMTILQGSQAHEFDIPSEHVTNLTTSQVINSAELKQRYKQLMKTTQDEENLISKQSVDQQAATQKDNEEKVAKEEDKLLECDSTSKGKDVDKENPIFKSCVESCGNEDGEELQKSELTGSSCSQYSVTPPRRRTKAEEDQGSDDPADNQPKFVSEASQQSALEEFAANISSLTLTQPKLVKFYANKQIDIIRIKSYTKTIKTSQSQSDACQLCTRPYKKTNFLRQPAQADSSQQWILPSMIDRISPDSESFSSVCKDCSVLLQELPYIEIPDSHKYKNKNISNAVYYHKQFQILSKLIKCKPAMNLFPQGIIDRHVTLNRLVLKNTPLVSDVNYSFVGTHATDNNQLHQLISGKLAKTLKAIVSTLIAHLGQSNKSQQVCEICTAYQNNNNKICPSCKNGSDSIKEYELDKYRICCKCKQVIHNYDKCLSSHKC